MENAVVKQDELSAIEKVLIKGDLKVLTQEQRQVYYLKLCESLGLNPLTRPFEYLELQGKLILYARKDATDQLRSVRKVSVSVVDRQKIDDLIVVTARATLPNGRSDDAVGAVNAQGLRGEALANAMMKAETKAKRRVTLSICGLGMTDESEVDSIPGAKRMSPEADRQKLSQVNDLLGAPKPEPKEVVAQVEPMNFSDTPEDSEVSDSWEPPTEQAPLPKQDPNTYAITFGRSKGSMVGQLNDFELKALKSWIETKAEKPLGRPMLALLDACNQVLMQRTEAAKRGA